MVEIQPFVWLKRTKLDKKIAAFYSCFSLIFWNLFHISMRSGKYSCENKLRSAVKVKNSFSSSSVSAPRLKDLVVVLQREPLLRKTSILFPF